VLGPTVFARALSVPTARGSSKTLWQYHSRSDRHSKVGCALILFDLLAACQLLAAHARAGKVGFGVNHRMVDFRNNRKKDLDLVLCTPPSGARPDGQTLLDLGRTWSLDLTGAERAQVDALPAIRRAPVGAVLVALEAKACMTAHQKALPRLYDELNSSHLTIHGASAEAIAAGFVCVNAARRFISPGLNAGTTADTRQWTNHAQPKSAQIAIDKVRQLPRRNRISEDGYDALGIVVVDLANDGSQVALVTAAPAPAEGEIDHYRSMIDRIAAVYASRFAAI
jgi:hypothetical protein